MPFITIGDEGYARKRKRLTKAEKFLKDREVKRVKGIKLPESKPCIKKPVAVKKIITETESELLAKMSKRPFNEKTHEKLAKIYLDKQMWPEAELHHRIERALAAVGMSGFEQRVPHHLSLGQRKRIAVATVLSMDPGVLVFDEPTAGLDPRGRRELMAVMAARPETLLVSTHDLAMVAETLPRTVVLDGGAVVADGPSTELLRNEALLEAHGLESPFRLPGA